MLSGVAAAPTAPEFEGVAGGAFHQRAPQQLPSEQPSAPSLNVAAAAMPSSAAPSSSVGATSSATTVGAKYDEQFASSRAISRLIEMSSTQYLEACARHRDQQPRSAAAAAFAPDEDEPATKTLSQQHLQREKAATSMA
jgi:hypothetical protein